LFQDRVKSLLRTYIQRIPVPLADENPDYQGEKFVVLTRNTTDTADNEVGKEFLRKIVLMNLRGSKDKFRIRPFMSRKLYDLALDLVVGSCCLQVPVTLMLSSTRRVSSAASCTE
jgi:hypothetical protein